MNNPSSEKTHVQTLKEQLQEALYLDLDEYGLDEPEDGEFTSSFLGMRIRSAFQPIYNSAEGELFGHEALLRPSLGSAQEIEPEFAFGFADQSGRLVKFDRICRTLHLLNFRQIYAESGLLFLNVHPQLLLSVNAHGKVFERILHANSIPTDRVVIEINESVITEDNQLKDAVENYRERHYQIAIDHFADDRSSLNRLWKLLPDFVKLDRKIIQEAEYNPKLRKALPKLIHLIRDFGAQPVIAGIETQKQFDIALESGSTLLQGYFLGHPVRAKELKPPTVFNPTTPVTD
ncbi:MAG: EAL domain-containing protein [Methylophilaceae bacterium]|nr:EAL domain-containing protein [Methylophilaceae bacterium]